MRPAALAVSPPCARAGDPSCTAPTAGLVDGWFGPALAVDETPPWRAMPRRRSCVAPGRGGRRIPCRRRRRSVACRTCPCERTLPNTPPLPLPPRPVHRRPRQGAWPIRTRRLGVQNCARVSTAARGFGAALASASRHGEAMRAHGSMPSRGRVFEGSEALWRTPYIVAYLGFQGGGFLTAWRLGG